VDADRVGGVGDGDPDPPLFVLTSTVTERARALCPDGVPSLRVCGRVISFHALGAATGQRVTDVCGGAGVEGTVFAKDSADTDSGKDHGIFVGMNPQGGKARRRRPLAELFRSEADIVPDPENGGLRVRILGTASDAAIAGQEASLFSL